MKSTDYACRAAFMDSLLTGTDLVGIEVGADNGAHCISLLKYCSVKHLTIVDTWSNPEMKGYCKGRLESHGYKQNIKMIQGTSHEVSILLHFMNQTSGFQVDFCYIDITHDYFTVKQSLEDWWPKLKSRGLLGYRNYADSNEELKRAVDEFILEKGITKTEISKYHNEICLFK